MTARTPRKALLLLVFLLVAPLSIRSQSTPIFSVYNNPLFYTVPTYTTGGYYSSSVAEGDFNLDGKKDLLVANSSLTSPSIAVLLGNGDGSFQAPLLQTVLNGPEAVAAGDFNGDGKLDAAVAVYGNVSFGSVAVLFGNGDGTFQNEQDYSMPPYANAIAPGDFNLDGKLDLAVVSMCDTVCINGSVNILLNKGDGTFKPAVSYPVAGHAQSLAIGFFDGDAAPDLAVGSNGLSILLGNGDGTFKPAVNYPGMAYIASIVAQDFNRDARTDLVLSGASDLSGDHIEMDVMLGAGDGTFVKHTTDLSLGGVPSALASGDFNHDGNVDLSLATVVSMKVILGNGDGTFQSATGYAVPPDSRSVVSVDLDGDNNSDLAIATYDGFVSVLPGESNGRFLAPFSIPTQVTTYAVAASDLNHDRKPDLVLTKNCIGISCVSGGVTVMLGNGNGTFQPALDYTAQHLAYYTAIADFNHDGNPDLAVANYCIANTSNCADGSVSIFLGKGDGTFQPAGNYPTGGGSVWLAAADFNQDRKLDLAVANYCFNTTGSCTRSFSILLGNGDGSFQSPIVYPTPINPRSLVAYDVDRDGKLDLAIASQCVGPNCDHDTVTVWRNQGGAVFKRAAVFGAPKGATGIAVADFNHNGIADLAVSTRCGDTCSTGSINIVLDRGKSNVGYDTPGACESLAIADFDGDGNLDVACGTSGNLRNLYVLLGNGDGSLQQAQTYVETSALGMAVSDFNGDRKPDLVLAPQAPSVTLLLNVAQH
jgi:hypothetical protein